ncbi:hypothetical protein ACFOD9_01475 [Novosphingobium bradum]|uniref:Peptidase M15A C-terminal domain-containing protein n=1 Tax=Novosphingobium bradum TaxID=1737444 RepID=A0ABV7IMU7_9SPHN
MAARRLSNHFTAADLCCAGETWQRTRIINAPVKPESWAALTALCQHILEPVFARFGSPTITYGFTSPALIRLIPAHSAPRVDQHASCEVNARGKPICDRGGAAVDFAIGGPSSRDVAVWVTEHLPFDRLYFYGDDSPLHVSYGPEHTGQVVNMTPGPSGRRVPRVIDLARLRLAD